MPTDHHKPPQHTDQDTWRPRFWRLTVLNILTNITVPLAGLVDMAMLGHLPDIRFLAGVALGGLIFDYVYWTLGFLRMSTTGLTAQAFGRDDLEAGERTLGRSTILAASIAVLILLFSKWLGDAGFAVLSGAPEVEDAGREYYDIRIWGAPATLLNMVFLGWFLGREESRLALAMTIVGNVANIVLNYLFILRLGWAAYGAGLATMVSQYATLAVAIALYLPRRTPGTWGPALFHRDRFLALMKLNNDILIRTLCLVSSFAIFTNLSAIAGTAILAANTLLLRLLNFAAYFIDGAAFATESLAGIFSGTDEGQQRLRPLLYLALIAGLVFSGFFVLAAAFGPDVILGILTSHEDVIALGKTYAPWLYLLLPIGALAYILDGYFLGLTAGRVLRNAQLISFFLIFLPLIAIAWHADTVHALWLAFSAFFIARVVTLGWAVRGTMPPPGPQRPEIAERNMDTKT